MGGERESGRRKQASKEVVLPHSPLLFTLFYSVRSLLVVPRHICLRHWTSDFRIRQGRDSSAAFPHSIQAGMSPLTSEC